MPKQPNILFILMDDLGARDLSCYGSTFYETPNLDRLAAEGMTFTDAYAACPVCSPTRASLMTGKYPARVGVTDWIDWGGNYHPCRGRLVDAPYVDHLPLEETSVAAALKEGGYQTWHVGKWHLGREDYWPEKHGFDVNVGGWTMGSPKQGYFSPWGFPTLADGPEGEYLPDRLASEAIKLIKGRRADQPFFLNLWHYLVHTPIQAPAELVAKYEAKARELGLDAVPTFAEGDAFAFDHKKDQRIKRRLVQSDPVYAAMVESMDTNIGRVLAGLEEEGLMDNTLIVFTSDNGGLATAEGSPTCNAPLAEGKGWMYEGGVRECMIATWRGQVAPGSVCSTPISSPDIYPTFLDAAGSPPRPEQHVDGVSLLPLLTESGDIGERALFWHYPHYGNQGGTPGASVRCGDWKLIEFFEGKRVELYNLRDDIGETNDLAAAQPMVAARLLAQLHAWQEEVGALEPEIRERRSPR